MSKQDLHHISRIDQTREGSQTHGWYVRVQRDGKIHSKLFSDGIYGTKEKALKKAKEYRDDLLQKLTE